MPDVDRHIESFPNYAAAAEADRRALAAMTPGEPDEPKMLNDDWRVRESYA